MKIHEKDIFLLITDKCNLKCFACGYGCEKDDNSWFISEEEFLITLQKLSKTHLDNCSNYSINLTGGDPLLHKDWFKFALMVKEICPNQICYISTSGVLLPSLSDEMILECYKKQIYFGITVYPSMKLLPLYQKIEEKFNRIGIGESLTWNPIRMIFGKPSYTPIEYREKCFQDLFPRCDCCFIYKNKFYNCQTLFYQDVYLNENNSSWTIDDIQFNSNLKNINTLKDCQNCKMSVNESILWHLKSEVPEHCTLTPLKDLFLNDYDNYYLLQHDCKEQLKCLEHEFFKKYWKEKFLHPIARTRFYSGKADIFIPFNKTIPKEMSNLLKQQNDIDNYNIYLVSYTNDKNINEIAYESFYLPHKNIFFLKANSFLNANHVFMQNSYLNKKYCLDINDYSCLMDKDFIKNI